ncbi:MAG: FecR domain-containing protein [Elusimicrobia bacterium]|nr:FecR domain-containing protein [Elusimicrobiota bacterium]
MLALFSRPAAAAAPAGPSVAGASGLLQLRPALDAPWATLEKIPSALGPGAALRTGRQSSAFLKLGGADTALLQEDTVLTLEDVGGERFLARVEIGVSVFRFADVGRRVVQVRTPAAALTVRGGEFRVSVLAGGRTTVESAEGELGVEDNRGHQLLLRSGESVRIDLRGLEVPVRMPAAAALRREGLRERIRAELESDAFREGLYASGAEALRRLEWEEGRTAMDSRGARVRAESWVRRPRADQLELVAVNGREGRTDYLYHLGTFSAAVPGDISGALRALAGTAGAAPALTLTAYESARSNGPDVLMETADGGHLVDLNANADGADDVSSVFDPVTGDFRSAAGASAWRSLFDRWGVYVNGRLAAGWTGANILVNGDAVPSTVTDPFTGGALTAAHALMNGAQLAARAVSVTYPAPSARLQVLSSSWAEGSSLSTVSRGLCGGEVASAALPAGSGAAAFRAVLLGAGLEQSVSSSLFSGRTIELRLDPALAFMTGALP